MIGSVLLDQKGCPVLVKLGNFVWIKFLWNYHSYPPQTYAILFYQTSLWVRGPPTHFKAWTKLQVHIQILNVILQSLHSCTSPTLLFLKIGGSNFV